MAGCTSPNFIEIYGDHVVVCVNLAWNEWPCNKLKMIDYVRDSIRSPSPTVIMSSCCLAAV